MSKPTFQIFSNGILVAESSWLPPVAASWHVVSSSLEDKTVELVKDGKSFGVRETRKGGLPWPDRDTKPSNEHDVIHSIAMLARHMGFNRDQLAETAQARGMFHESANRIHRASKGSVATSADEAVVLLDALTSLYLAGSEKK